MKEIEKKSSVSKSTTAIVVAIAGNLAIAVIKFVAAPSPTVLQCFRRRSAVVDTGNDALMLLGLYKSRQPPDFDHPFGHGRELYFWTFIVAILIFAVGGGFSAYEGIAHISHATLQGNTAWSYAVLGLAFVFDGTSWFFDWKAFSAERGSKGVLETIHDTKDPTSFSVLLAGLLSVEKMPSLYSGQGSI